jgi:hypothetical protein
MSINLNKKRPDGVLVAIIGILGPVKNPFLVTTILGIIIFNLFACKLPGPEQFCIMIITILIFVAALAFYCYLMMVAPGTLQEKEFANSTRIALRQHKEEMRSLQLAADVSRYDDDTH